MEPYRIDIMTLFPDSMRAVLGESIIGRAAKKLSLIHIFFPRGPAEAEAYPRPGEEALAGAQERLGAAGGEVAVEALRCV